MTLEVLSTSLNMDIPMGAAVVGGEGVHLLLEDGRRILDASNTAAPLGHRHPELMGAIQRGADAPALNEGWPWPGRSKAAQALFETAFKGEEHWAGGIRFVLSGSEANDQALSLSQAITGRARLVTRERAYHGGSGLARDTTVQPHWHGGLSSRHGGWQSPPRSVQVTQIPAPKHALFDSAPTDQRIDPTDFDVECALHDAAAVILDYSQGGIYPSRDYQERVAAAAKRAEAIWIADEVVTGLGREGFWFAFQLGSSRPDIVTLGKPLAGGVPSGAIVVSKRICELLRDHSWRSYSTFRGHPIIVEAVGTTVQIIEREGLIQRVAELDSVIRKQLGEIASAHPSVSRIDGRGLHWTIEIHGPSWRHWYADTDRQPPINDVVQGALEKDVLIGTSGEEISMFLAPPLIVSNRELEQIMYAIDCGLGVADLRI